MALTDLSGSVLLEVGEQLDIARGPVEVLGWLTTTGDRLLTEAGWNSADLAGVGIGLPGPVEHSSGRAFNPPIMPGWDGFDVPAYVGERLGGPILVDNDVNIMALGEHASVYPDVEHLVFVKVATGIGAGIISGGRLHRGAQGAAGDLGHVRAPHGDDVPCRCGNTGCLEAIASGPAIAARLRSQGVDVPDSREVAALAKAGDLATLQVVRQAGRDIGDVLATLVSMLNPSVIVLGGVMSMAVESLLAGVREVVYGRSLPLATGNLQIVASQTGEQAGVIGAATLVIQHVLAPEQIDAKLSRAG
jgi:predicted NBD/HSP70 family sugar kinase